MSLAEVYFALGECSGEGSTPLLFRLTSGKIVAAGSVSVELGEVVSACYAESLERMEEVGEIMHAHLTTTELHGIVDEDLTLKTMPIPAATVWADVEAAIKYLVANPNVTQYELAKHFGRFGYDGKPNKHWAQSMQRVAQMPYFIKPAICAGKIVVFTKVSEVWFHFCKLSKEAFKEHFDLTNQN